MKFCLKCLVIIIEDTLIIKYNKILDLEDFKDYWLGNICDISDVERVGFDEEIKIISIYLIIN